MIRSLIDRPVFASLEFEIHTWVTSLTEIGGQFSQDKKFARKRLNVIEIDTCLNYSMYQTDVYNVYESIFNMQNI